MNKRIAIVIVTYERLLATKRCIESLYQNTNRDFNLYLVDNSSRTEVKDYIKSLNEPRTFFLEENVGLYKALNYGISQIDEDLISFLDCDIIVSPNWLNKFESEIMKKEKTALVGPRYIFPDGSLQEGYPRLSKEGWYGNNREEKAVPTSCQYIAIGCSLFTREAWELVGGFDERFFISHGDIDFCYKLRYEGNFELKYCPTLSIIHDHEFGKEKEYEQVRFNEIICERDFDLFKSKWQSEYLKELNENMFP